MLVYDVESEFIGNLPALDIVILVVRMGVDSGSADDGDFRMGLADPVEHILETLAEFRGDVFLVSDSYHLEIERLRMALCGTDCAPFGIGSAVRPLYEVKSVSHPLFHVLHRNGHLGVTLEVP